MIINVVVGFGGGGSNGCHILLHIIILLFIIYYYYSYMPTVKPVLYWCSVYYVLGRARALLFSLALQSRHVFFFFFFGERWLWRVTIYDMCIYFSFSSPRYCHTQCIRRVGVYGYYIYIIYIMYNARRTDHAVSCNTIWRIRTSVRRRGLSRTRPPPLPDDHRLGPPPKQLQTDRLPTYRPTDGRAFIYLQTSLCSSSSHHHHPRTILGDLYYYVCVYIYV